jgi:hypothetical protein
VFQPQIGTVPTVLHQTVTMIALLQRVYGVTTAADIRLTSPLPRTRVDMLAAASVIWHDTAELGIGYASGHLVCLKWCIEQSLADSMHR